MSNQGSIPTYDEFIQLASYMDASRAPKANIIGTMEGFRIHESIEFSNMGISNKQIKFVLDIYGGAIFEFTTLCLPNSKNEFIKYLPYVASPKVMDSLEIKRVSASNRHMKRMRIHALNIGMSTKFIDELYNEYLKSFLR